MKTKTISQVGIIVGGEAILNLWGGGKGTIEMKNYFLPNGKITAKNILRCVNDNGFGCESIESAIIDIYIQYDNGSKEYSRTLQDFIGLQTEYFLGWEDLKRQGINV